MGPLQKYLNVPQFKWFPNNNIDPGARAPSIYVLPTNLNGPSTITFKWATNNSIDPRIPGPLNLIFANQLKNAPYNI